MLNNKKNIFFALALITSNVNANDISSLDLETPSQEDEVREERGITVGEIERLQENNIRLEAKVEEARLKKQLKEYQDVNLLSNGEYSGLPMPITDYEKNKNPTPYLKEIIGKNSKLSAVIVLPDGRVTELSIGKKIPNTHLFVKKITENSVVVSDGTIITF
ncbi:type IV pilus biogenesis protein PilP [Xenorhabdus nematophila]|uniref:type IV pilus biogenesis protein PilP n=1 Tax=Xenorhabdus nematophila TaxID=628 RepID=UPI0032B7A8C1